MVLIAEDALRRAAVKRTPPPQDRHVARRGSPDDTVQVAATKVVATQVVATKVVATQVVATKVVATQVVATQVAATGDQPTGGAMILGK